MILVTIMTKEQKGIVLKFVIEIGKKPTYKDGKRIVVDDVEPSGEPRYRRNDALGLSNLLHLFDSRQHSAKEWGFVGSIKEKLYDCIIYEKTEIKLSDEEADFLVDYLEQFPSKEGKDRNIQDNEIIARGSVLEQLNE